MKFLQISFVVVAVESQALLMAPHVNWLGNRSQTRGNGSIRPHQNSGHFKFLLQLANAGTVPFLIDVQRSKSNHSFEEHNANEVLN